MALTYTPRNEHTTLPAFYGETVFGKIVDNDDIENLPLKVIVFICGHCPYVLAIEDRLIALAPKIEKLGGRMIAVCSNDPTEYEEDRKENLAKRAKEKNYTFDYIVDESQKIAHDFGAVCTPDFFVYDKDSRLQYRGRLDDSWRDAAKVRKEELYEAARSIVENGQLNKEIEVAPSMGCSIKWK